MLIREKKHNLKFKNYKTLARLNNYVGDIIIIIKIEEIDRADSEGKLKLIELQHIIKQKPLINKQLNTDSKYEIKTLIAAHSDLPHDN